MIGCKNIAITAIMFQNNHFVIFFTNMALHHTIIELNKF